MTIVLAKSPLPSKDTRASSLPCYQWNDGTCHLIKCKYAHICAVCSGAHRKQDCEKLVSAQPSDRDQSPVPKKSARR